MKINRFFTVLGFGPVSSGKSDNSTIWAMATASCAAALSFLFSSPDDRTSLVDHVEQLETYNLVQAYTYFSRVQKQGQHRHLRPISVVHTGISLGDASMER